MRRIIESALTVLAATAAVMLLLTVTGLLGFVVWQAWPALQTGWLFGDTPVWAALTGAEPVWDGLWPALAGSLCLVGLSVTLALPLGVATGIWQAEASPGVWSRLQRSLIDLLAGMPSIVMGLFGFVLILLLRRLWPAANTSLMLASLCVALLVLPYMALATRSALVQLPRRLRDTADALGLSRRQAMWHVFLPAIRRDIMGGVVLALGRAAEDVAVILLTGAVASAGLPHWFGKFEALPFFIMVKANEYRDEMDLARAFVAALLLLGLAGGLVGVARRLERKMLES
ncbi:ABC transporter permease subunit [Laribacter hongkongensis]|uniref:PstA family ABC transporter permease n=1 Tax=Laribacter hongkongensis TaxID=168471 RepID=UPI001EFDE26B|nr:ABC transporter permease subunit [Laribacter hongkongensis]MCG9107380.1 ABC transporter permease subunit [Laribacter hongkongensis]